MIREVKKYLLNRFEKDTFRTILIIFVLAYSIFTGFTDSWDGCIACIAVGWLLIYAPRWIVRKMDNIHKLF